jgi:spore coat protein U-like protein
LSVSSFRDLQFGSAAPDNAVAGTVVVDANGVKSVTGGASDFGGTHSEGQFRVKDANGVPYSCTLPSQIQLSSGANTVDVTNLTTDIPLSGILPGGWLTIKIGGTLQLPAGQSAGSYSGTLTLDCGAAQNSITVTATLATMISISSVTALEFGSAAPTGSAGTVTITPASVRTAVNVDLVGGVASAARFDVSGEAGQVYAITLPVSATMTGPGADMVVDTFVDDNASPSLTGGADTFNVGATLHVGGNQASGTYLGTFPVTVSYN